MTDTRKTVGIGLVGSGFMGRCHANAFSSVAGLFDVPVTPVKVLLADATEEVATEAADAVADTAAEAVDAATETATEAADAVADTATEAADAASEAVDSAVELAPLGDPLRPGLGGIGSS